MLQRKDEARMMQHESCCELSAGLSAVGVSGHRGVDKRASHVLTSGAVEVEEAARGKVHPLLALAVVVQGDLLRLHTTGSFQEPVCRPQKQILRIVACLPSRCGTLCRELLRCRD